MQVEYMDVEERNSHFEDFIRNARMEIREVLDLAVRPVQEFGERSNGFARTRRGSTRCRRKKPVRKVPFADMDGHWVFNAPY